MTQPSSMGASQDCLQPFIWHARGVPNRVICSSLTVGAQTLASRTGSDVRVRRYLTDHPAMSTRWRPYGPRSEHSWREGSEGG
jgi:hypothetical protein